MCTQTVSRYPRLRIWLLGGIKNLRCYVILSNFNEIILSEIERTKKIDWNLQPDRQIFLYELFGKNFKRAKENIAISVENPLRDAFECTSSRTKVLPPPPPPFIEDIVCREHFRFVLDSPPQTRFTTATHLLLHEGDDERSPTRPPRAESERERKPSSGMVPSGPRVGCV